MREVRGRGDEIIPEWRSVTLEKQGPSWVFLGVDRGGERERTSSLNWETFSKRFFKNKESATCAGIKDVLEQSGFLV